MNLVFKKNELGEYIDTTNTYKIEKNEESRMWNLYIRVDGSWEWEFEDDAKKWLVERVNNSIKVV